VTPRSAVTAAWLVAAVAAHPAEAQRLTNGLIEARFGDRGLTSITDRVSGATHRFAWDEFALSINGQAQASRGLPTPRRAMSGERVIYEWAAGPTSVRVVYEVKPGWRFVSKHLEVTRALGRSFTVDEVTVLDAALGQAPADVFVSKSGHERLGTGDYAAALRFTGGRGLLALVQNPFLEIAHGGTGFSIRYRPDLRWDLADGPFPSDRGLLAPYVASGERLPAAMVPEWALAAPAAEPGMDRAEVEAFTEMVRASLISKPQAPVTVLVGWCANDYQIDVATADGRAEYRRLIDRAAELGAGYVLYGPSNSELSRREESADDWSWEHVLWLGLGQRIRKNEWDIGAAPLPPSVREMLDHARGRNVKLLAYVYPVVPFSQNADWLVSRADRPGRRYANLGFRSLQDWLIEALVTFHRRTGIGGYAFDHAFLAYDGASRYAQWWGWRRVMEELRRRVPDLVIDGRQAYHLYGPWSWLAGTYPHPTMQDEQPESFVPFPDLHFDRVSANRERYTAYQYRNYEFAPSEIVPGFIGHQTSRSDESGEMPSRRTERGVLLEPYRVRDWDYLGWRYSLLSSIAVAGWNNVLNLVPARDLEEHRWFADADKAWLKGWLDWTVTHKEHLRRTRTILGQPAFGRIDGTSAILGDSGFVFLFNPNGRRLEAELTLDGSIGLDGTGPFVITELHPLEGRRIGKPDAGAWTRGDRVTVPMDGGSALVLRVEPAPARDPGPSLYGAPGSASLESGVLRLTAVRGEAGTTERLFVSLPNPAGVSAVEVNGQPTPFRRVTGGITTEIRFQGPLFRHYQQLDTYDPAFSGGTVRGTFTIPGRIFEQLAARRRAWPISWTPEDYRATWLAPERLLLFVQIANPDERTEVRLRIDGRQVELRRAYSAIRVVPHTFVGFYADVSLLEADREYRFELDLPPLEPGRYQGLFVENVETEYTEQVGPPA
jgi:hypothetical protein